MYVVNGSDGRCLVAVRLIVGVRYLERPLREVLLYTCVSPQHGKLFYLILISASYYYAPCMALALVLYCVRFVKGT